MKLDRAFLGLNIALLLTCAAVHEVGSEQYYFLIGAVVACAFVWRSELSGQRIYLNKWVSGALIVLLFVTMVGRSMGPTQGQLLRVLDVRVPPIGEFLISYMCISLFNRGTPRDYFWYYLVSVVLMGTGAMLLPSVGYAFFFIAYAVTGIAALSVFNMWSEARRHPDIAASLRVRKRTMLGLAPIVAVLMIPIGVIFIALPRRTTPSSLAPELIRLGVQPVAGFSKSVQLGQIGTIQDNPQRVMHVTVIDPETQKSIRVSELLLRGTGLDEYALEESGWVWRQSETASRADFSLNRRLRQSLPEQYVFTYPTFGSQPATTVECRIVREPLDTQLLFVPFAAEQVQSNPPRSIFFNRLTHDIGSARLSQTNALEYTVTSQMPVARSPGPGPFPDAPNYVRTFFMKLPDEMPQRVIDLARQIAPDSAYPTDYQKAQRILAYLSNSEEYSYTVTMEPTPDAEPVEDFLFNLKRGHCEYFASAMTVMLRAVGVPARMVNGFKMNEWNPISESYVVRQANAHSWCEAYIRGAGWMTFDPSVMRDAATPQPHAVTRLGQNIHDALETLWVNYVLNFDADSQETVYKWARNVAAGIYRVWSYTLVRAGGQTLGMHRRQVKRVIRYVLAKLQTPAQQIVALATAAIVLYLAAMFLMWLRNLWRKWREKGGALYYYQRMERILARHGHERSPAQTPWEFHDSLRLADWPEMTPVQIITENFCRARYGNRTGLEPEREAIRQALDKLQTVKRSNSQK